MHVAPILARTLHPLLLLASLSSYAAARPDAFEVVIDASTVQRSFGLSL